MDAAAGQQMGEQLMRDFGWPIITTVLVIGVIGMFLRFGVEMLIDSLSVRRRRRRR